MNIYVHLMILNFSGTPPYDYLAITTTFLCPERIEIPVISLLLPPH